MPLVPPAFRWWLGVVVAGPAWFDHAAEKDAAREKAEAAAEGATA